MRDKQTEQDILQGVSAEEMLSCGHVKDRIKVISKQ